MRKVLNRKMLTITLLSLTSGVPLGVTMNLVQTWLTEAGHDLKTLGLIALVQLPYTIKFLWAPLMDRYTPFGSRRRGWMIVSQIGMLFSVGYIGFFDPSSSVTIILGMAVTIAFFGASHDIVIDAYRRDVLTDEELGFGSAVASNAYLIGFRFLTTMLGMFIASYTTWQNTFLFFSGVCLLGVVGALIAPPPIKDTKAPNNLKDAIVGPFLNYLKRPGAIEILLFIVLYKVGDNFASNLLTPFYLKIGYSKIEIAAVGKMVGLWATFVGTFVGGFFLFRYSIRKCLLWFGFLQAFSTVGFSILNELLLHTQINRLMALTTVIGFENLTAGMGTAAYSAFMLKLTDRQFSATQYALLTSFMGITRVIIPSAAGFVAEPLGWTEFFVVSTLLAIPGLLMIFFRGKKWEESLPS